MKKIHILGNRGSVRMRHLQPVLAHRRSLAEMGYDVAYFPGPSARGIEDCDVLIFMEGSYRDMLPIREKDRGHSVEYLGEFLRRFPKVIWFDDHDSSGMLRTYVFPLVDIYAKAQLLTDKTYYRETHLTGVPHRDFVDEHFDVEEKGSFKGPASDDDIAKLRVGWHLGLIDWKHFASRSKLERLFRRAFRGPSDGYALAPVTTRLADRSVHASYRVGMHRSTPTVNWWRRTGQDLLREFSRRNDRFRIHYEGAIPRDRYRREMEQTIVVPSPFGVGEICYRDFECFLSGAVLLKPKMDHLETWPDLFVDGETFVSFAWDYGDFVDKLAVILDDPGRYEAIAREGQRRFVRALGDGEGFARRFASMLGE